MRWLLLGYGDLADKRVTSALQQAKDSELSAVWGRNVNRCRDFAERHNVRESFASSEGLCEALKEDYDAVYVCTPVDSHLDYTVAALESGKHVLCEKPMAMDVEQCRRMISCAQKNNLTLGVAYYRRFFPNLIRIKEVVKSGQIGSVVSVNMNFHEWYCPERGSQQYWRVLPERAGGGVSYDVGSHRLDLLSYWFGNVEPVTTYKSNCVHDYPAEDTAIFLMRLKDCNNAPAVLNVSWAVKVRSDELVITGSEGTIIAGNLSGPEFKIVTTNEVIAESHVKAANVHLPLIEDFIAAVNNGRSPACDGLEGLKTNLILEAVRR